MTTPIPDARAQRARRWWRAIWRLGAVTVLGVAAFILTWGMALETAPLDAPEANLIGLSIVLDLAVGPLIIVLYALRHRLPRVAPSVGVALSTFSTLGAVAAAALVVTVAARRRSRTTAVQTVLIAALFFAIAVAPLPIHPPSDNVPFRELVIVGAVATASLVLLGLLVGARRQLQRERQERGLAAEAGRLTQARTQERARIAREMHDALGHRLSLITVHAGALEYRHDLSAGQIGQTAALIRENTRVALDELRVILGVLRDGAPVSPMSGPPPQAEDITSLVEEARAAGSVIDVEEFQIDGIPGAVGRSLFRIAQELLTNARRHAPGERVTLRLTQHDSTVRLVARNAVDATPPSETEPGGYGLIGVAERARLSGGEYTMTRNAGTFEVSVVIPWQS
ncbi:hypothetical protein IM711_12250 [Microbacterium esteraromaticum]|uniref:sensor histidine kinase n=1 Tax=Microbacterium esteraromaticum TaxID=57043 RepID=UPI003C2C3F8F